MINKDPQVTRSDRSGCGLKPRHSTCPTAAPPRHPLRSERVWIETQARTDRSRRSGVTRSDRSGCGLKPAPRKSGDRECRRHPLRSERVWIETCRTRHTHPSALVTRSDRSGCGLKHAGDACGAAAHSHPLRSERVWIETRTSRLPKRWSLCHPLRSERVWIETPRASAIPRSTEVTRSDRSGCGLKPRRGGEGGLAQLSPAPIGAGVD